MKKNALPLTVRLLRVAIHILGIVAPAFAANWVNRIWFSTPRYPEPRRETRWRESAQLQYLDSDSQHIAVYRWGEPGLPIVYLVHGWSGRATQLGAFVRPLLDRGYAVISFDAPGHGMSSGKSTNIYKITSVFNDVIQAHGQPAHIIAHSFGCMVSALLVKKYAISPNSMVTISSPTRVENLIELFSTSLQLDDRIARRFKHKLEAEFGSTLYQDLAADENLRGNNMPVLVVHDKQDSEVQWTYSQKLLDVMPNAVALYTQGLGHRRILRDKHTIRQIVDFMERHNHDKY